MVNLKLLPAFASYMAMADDALQVNISIDKAEVPRGDSVTYTCTWNLDAEYADYEIEDFQLFWKLNDDGARQSVARYQPGETPDEERKIFYHNTQVTDRIDLTADFSGLNVNEQSASLTITDLNLQDDDMLISCEVHWASRYGVDETPVNVYVDASDVQLEAIETQLEGRERTDINGTVFAVEEAEVASCNIFNVYPEPSSVTFTVGDEEIEVEATAEAAEEEGLFSIAATLTLMPSAEYDQKDVSCFSQASSMAPQVGPTNANATATLDVTYYTTEVTLELRGANENDEGYYINENEEYEVLCRANGNPAPEVTITGPDGVEIPTRSQAIAVRHDSVQYILCSAENNDEEFNAGDPVQAEKELDVYYLDEPITDIAEQYTYGDEVTINCKAEGNPAPQFSWTKDDQSLAGGSSHTFSSIQMPLLLCLHVKSKAQDAQSLGHLKMNQNWSLKEIQSQKKEKVLSIPINSFSKPLTKEPTQLTSSALVPIIMVKLLTLSKSMKVMIQYAVLTLTLVTSELLKLVLEPVPLLVLLLPFQLS